jgi:hypothetical protein
LLNLLVVDGERRTLSRLQMALASSKWAPPVKTTILFTRIWSSGHLVIWSFLIKRANQ